MNERRTVDGMGVIARWEARPWTDTGAVFDVTSDVPEAALRVATCRTMGDAEMIARALNALGAVGRIAALEEALDLAGTRLGEYRDYDGTREVEDALGRAIGGQ